MHLEDLKKDWLSLGEGQRERLLLTLRADVTERLELEEDTFSLPNMHVGAFYRRGTTLFLHVVMDLMESHQAQSGSDWDEHLVYATEAAFTLHHALISQETKVEHYGSIIEYQAEYYDREAVLQRTIAKVTERLMDASR